MHKDVLKKNLTMEKVREEKLFIDNSMKGTELKYPSQENITALCKGRLVSKINMQENNFIFIIISIHLPLGF